MDEPSSIWIYYGANSLTRECAQDLGCEGRDCDANIFMTFWPFFLSVKSNNYCRGRTQSSPTYNNKAKRDTDCTRT